MQGKQGLGGNCTDIFLETFSGLKILKVSCDLLTRCD
jgi:hypothetical protein